MLFLVSRGHADAEIEAVFAKYDLDGDRILDEEEQRKMQEDLEGQKVRFLGLNSNTCLLSRVSPLILLFKILKLPEIKISAHGIIVNYPVVQLSFCENLK